MMLERLLNADIFGDGLSGIIFDMDGVIFDSESVWKRTTEKINSRFGIVFDEKYRQSLCGMDERGIRSKLKMDYPGKDVDNYRDTLVKAVTTRLSTEPLTKNGFLELVETCRLRGMKVGLATSSSRGRAEIMFSNNGMNMESLFDAVVFGTEVVRSKPDPEIFLLAASRLGIPNSECIVVEDSLNGLRAAHEGGFVPVMVVDLIEPDTWVLDNGIPVFRNLSELKDLLEGGSGFQGI